MTETETTLDKQTTTNRILTTGSIVKHNDSLYMIGYCTQDGKGNHHYGLISSDKTHQEIKQCIQDLLELHNQEQDNNTSKHQKVNNNFAKRMIKDIFYKNLHNVDIMVTEEKITFIKEPEQNFKFVFEQIAMK